MLDAPVRAAAIMGIEFAGEDTVCVLADDVGGYIILASHGVKGNDGLRRA